MADSAATAYIELDARTAKFITELNKAAAHWEHTERRMTRGAQEQATTFAKLGEEGVEMLQKMALAGAAAAAATAAALTALTVRAFEAGDALAKAADRVGVSTEALKTLQVAGQLAGVGQEQVTRALQRQQVAIAQAVEGTGKAADAFERLGLSVAELVRLPADQQFAAIVGALEGVENITVRNALAADIWGERLSEMLNLVGATGGGLGELRQQLENMNVLMSRLDTAKLEQANDAVELAKLAAEGLGNSIAVAVAPYVQGLAEQFTKAAEASGGFQAQAQAAVRAVGAGAGYVGDAVLGISVAFQGAAGAALIAGGTIGGALAAVGKAVETVLINPFLAFIEVANRAAAVLRIPGSKELAEAAAQARAASVSTDLWTKSMNAANAGLELIGEQVDRIGNREIPSQAVDRWLNQWIEASNKAAAATAEAMDRRNQASTGAPPAAAGGGQAPVSGATVLPPPDPNAYLAGVSAALGRERELRLAAQSEITRLVTAGESQFSTELLNIAHATAAQRVAVAREEARVRAALQGKVFDPEAFDAEAQRLTELKNVFDQMATGIVNARARIASAEGGTILPGMSSDQVDAVIQQDLELRQIISANRVAEQAALNDLILTGESALNAALLKLATEQATAEVLARDEARRAALGSLGEAVTAEERLTLQDEINQLRLEKVREMQAQLTQAEAQGAAARQRLAQQEAQTRLGIARTVSSHLIGLVHAVAGESKGAALAILAVEKGLGIAQVVVDTQVAAMKALATLGPIAGPPAVAAIEATGAISIGLIAATGLAQAAGIVSGGGGRGSLGSVGGGGAGAVSTPALESPDLRAQQQQSVVTVNLNGEFVGWDAAVREHIIEAIRDAVDNRDVVIFSANSRQAREVVGG